MKFKAPGRINIIGEHTDYNDGFVLPFAIDRYVEVEIHPASKFVLSSEMMNETLEVQKNERTGKWTDYIMGVVWSLELEGLKIDPFEMHVASNLPVGSGLSSSAALEVASAYAILNLHGYKLEPMKIVEVCVRAERQFVGVRCGVMDQFTAVFAKKDHAILLDTMTMNYEYVPLDLKDHEFVLIDSHTKHELAGSEYNKRRQECEEVLRILQKRSFREVRHSDLDKLQGTLRKRARHVLDENDRVLKTVDALKKSRILLVGAYLYESHASLRDLYEVSCDETDFIVGFLKDRFGIVGARIVGGGFGGSVLVLARKGSLEGAFQELQEEYSKRFGKPITMMRVSSADGTLAMYG